MKTLVVVSALVALAVAAPAQPGDGLENTDHTQDLQTQSSLPDTTTRLRNSPSEISTSSMLNNGLSNSEVQNVQIDAGLSTPTARSFSLKKPLIVKKKYGYHVYRDSEEEKAHADSDESCGRQVKVKLCNEDKLKTSVTGTVHESADIQTSEDDVKHSIKMAKEAVENLQRDLKKMEMKGDMKSAHESHSDAELHEDIEVARQALKHIHENFGTIESMSLHATTTRNSEDMHDVHVTIAKTEEERMAQWKEAMENIQKNVEIAKNIEDSFKTASNLEGTSHLDQSEMASMAADKKTEENIHSHAALSEINNLRLAEDVALETHHQEKKSAEEMMLNKETNENMSDIHTEDDMNTAPSEMIEIHLDGIKNQEPLTSENHKIHEQERTAGAQLEEHTIHAENKDFINKEDDIVDHHQQKKSAKHDMDMLTGPSEHHLMQVPAPKVVEEGTETKLETEMDTEFKTTENIPVTPITTSTMIKPLNSDVFIKHLRTVEQMPIEDKLEHQLEQGKIAGDGMIDFFAKSADVHQDKKETNNFHKDHSLKLAKAAKTLKPVQEEHLAEHMEPKQAVETKNLDSNHETTQQLEHTHNLDKPNENVMLAKSVDHTSILNHQQQQLMQQEEMSSMETVPEMKAAQEHLHHLQHMHNAHWGNENRHLDHLASMKAAEEYDNEFRMVHGQVHGHGMMNEHAMDQLRNSHLNDHSQISGNMGAHHDFGLSSHVPTHLHHPSKYHNSMTHKNLREMNDMGSHSSFHMKDAMEGFGSDHMFRWQPAHEARARVDYGSGLSNTAGYGSGLSSSAGSSGAVGVFPKANVGGCAIPLLLSCSPSVVSGSLAKAHSASPASYSSPSYRNEEDFGFHNKRDVMKTNDMRTTNVQRSPSIVKQKSTVTLESKL